VIFERIHLEDQMSAFAPRRTFDLAPDQAFQLFCANNRATTHNLWKSVFCGIAGYEVEQSVTSSPIFSSAVGNSDPCRSGAVTALVVSGTQVTYRRIDSPRGEPPARPSSAPSTRPSPYTRVHPRLPRLSPTRCCSLHRTGPSTHQHCDLLPFSIACSKLRHRRIAADTVQRHLDGENIGIIRGFAEKLDHRLE